jgi:hypothetical protein
MEDNDNSDSFHTNAVTTHQRPGVHCTLPPELEARLTLRSATALQARPDCCIAINGCRRSANSKREISARLFAPTYSSSLFWSADIPGAVD